jgi:hypothetical protein
MLRDRSQQSGRKLSDIATAVVESHLLLLPLGPGEPERENPPVEAAQPR